MEFFTICHSPSQATPFLAFLKNAGVQKTPDLSAPAFLHHGHARRFVQVSDLRPRCCSHTISIARRSGNYQPTNWEYNFVQSIKHDCLGRSYKQRSTVLKEQVRTMLDTETDLLNQLELIDNLQRLGLFHYFNDKIQSILSTTHEKHKSSLILNKKGLYAAALGFRLLRENRFHIPQDTFNCFKDKEGDFKASLSDDTKGLLSLYEASFVQQECESTLELAGKFASEHLRKNLDENKVDQQFVATVEHALKLPIHWRMPRLEARWYIEEYSKKEGMIPSLLELAKMEFNILQETHQTELKHVYSWWENTGLAGKLTFARDRLVECFFWTLGLSSDPQHGYSRRMTTKVITLLTVIDDIYDVYGTLEELELFTDAIERWDVNAIDQLPDYMKLCYLAVFNSVNEMAYDALRDQDAHIVSHLREGWGDICKSYLQEAKWYFSGHIPTLQQYLNNAWISIAGPIILQNAHLFACDSVTIRGAQECMETHRSIIYSSSIIVRLADDLATSSEEQNRGDASTSIQCYMKETGASEEEAREYIKHLMNETWKALNGNKAAKAYNYDPRFIEMAMNLAKTAQCVYEYGDGHGHQDSQTRKRISALVFEPIQDPNV